MPYRPYPDASPLLFGYDPVRELPGDHLARLVEQVVEETLQPPPRPRAKGQPPFDPRLCVKVLVFGYATGIRSSRRLEQLCQESLPYLFLTRGDTPSYRTLCAVRAEKPELIERVWVGLFAVAEAAGMKRLGQIVVDATKLRACASPEAVLKAEEYQAVREELARILEEAQVIDAREAAEGRPADTRLGQAVDRQIMRDILRRVRKQLGQAQQTVSAGASASEPAPSRQEPTEGGSPPAGPTPAQAPGGDRAAAHSKAAPRGISKRMKERVKEAVAAIDAAAAEGRKHLCLTDPDARMMPEGRLRKIQECHSFEVAVDKGAALLVVAATSQEASDNARLEGIVEAACVHEPGGVVAADADSGYFGGDAIGRLITRGIDLCVPESETACDLHRGRPIGTTRASHQGKVKLLYDAEQDCYRCPEGNQLRLRQKDHQGYGQRYREYRAVRPCTGCPLAGECLVRPNARYRTVRVGDYADLLEAARQRFADPQHRERYRHRGEWVETVFAVLRSALGYTRWQVRGKEKVACEGRLFGLAYQLRKVQAARVAGQAG